VKSEKNSEDMFFGKKLKEIRLDAKMGVRKFAEKIDINASTLYKIERGYEHPRLNRIESDYLYPVGDLILDRIKRLLVDVVEEKKIEELYRLYEEPFVMQKMQENVVVSPLTAKTDGTQLTTEEHMDINDYINDIAREHNKKADIYNGKSK
jgi:transcriptional regulator with XRE-family HTH domain